MCIRDRILTPKHEPAALIEVNDSLYLVHAGSEITLQGRGLRLTPSSTRTSSRSGQGRQGSRAGFSSYTLRVTGIDADEVRIEITRLNKTITIR